MKLLQFVMDTLTVGVAAVVSRWLLRLSTPVSDWQAVKSITRGLRHKLSKTWNKVPVTFYRVAGLDTLNLARLKLAYALGKYDEDANAVNPDGSDDNPA